MAHNQPTFDAPQTEPILYLPPILSSLPLQFHTSTSVIKGIIVTTARLPTIDSASLSLHKALHRFKPVDADYADRPYGEAFNWDKLTLPVDEERKWYCVVFRSKRKEMSDGNKLYEADRKAHEEAVENGGLLMYWYGKPNEQTGTNLATCIWQSKKHAEAANARPEHATAMRLAAVSYESYQLERYVLRKAKGVACVSVEPYVSGGVGY